MLSTLFLLLYTAYFIIICVYNFDLSHTENRKEIKYKYVPFVCIALLCTIPSQTTIYLMATADIAEKIISNPSTKSIFEKSLKIIENKLDDVIDDKK